MLQQGEGQAGQWAVVVEKDIASLSMTVHMLRIEGHQMSYVSKMEMATETIDFGHMTAKNPPPFMCMSYQEVQDFMRAFMKCGWDMGLRPDGWEGQIQGELKAVREERDFLREMVVKFSHPLTILPEVPFKEG